MTLHSSLSIGNEAASLKPELRPFGSMAAYEDEKRQINDWFYAQWLSLLADKAAKEREADRKFWAGEYR